MNCVKKIVKSEQGSVTVYVLSTLLVVSMVLISVYLSVMNKKTAQYNQVRKVQNEYNEQATDEKMEENYDKISKQTISAADIVNASTDEIRKMYGAIVTNYVPAKTLTTQDLKWKIFYSDGKYIYLIADKYIHSNDVPASKSGVKPAVGSQKFDTQVAINMADDYGYNGTSDIDDSFKSLNNKYFSYLKQHNTTNAITPAAKAVTYLMDSSIWSKQFGDNSNSDAVFGGPTIEMLFQSYNAKYGLGEKYQTKVESPDGYLVSNDFGASWSYQFGTSGNFDASDSLYVLGSNEQGAENSWWIASPTGMAPENANASSQIYAVNTAGGVYTNWVSESPQYLSIRPVIRLKEQTTLQTNEDGTSYSINNQK